MENANSTDYLEKIKIAVIENLKKTAPVPSVQMQDTPRQGLGMTDEEEAELDDLDEDENKDDRVTERRWDKRVTRDDEFEESDDEDMATANGVHKTNGKRMGIMDYKNPHADTDVDSGAITPVNGQRDGSVAPAAEDEPEPETENHDADETMEDVEAQPKEVANDTTKNDKPAEPAANVDNDGDVDMEAAAEPETAIKQEDTEAASTTEDKPASPKAAAAAKETAAGSPKASADLEKATTPAQDGDKMEVEAKDDAPAASAEADKEKDS